MRLIDADVLIKTLQEREDAPPGWEGATFKDAFSIAIMDIIAQPSIDAESVKHGEWIKRKVISRDEAEIVMDEWQSAKCSVCGRYHTTPYIYRFYEDNYCPYCGARMDGGNTETDEGEE